MKKFSERLKELRQEKNLTQKQLANELAVTIPTLSHWECGYQEPNISQLIMLANYFEVSVDYLVGNTDL